MQPWLPKEQIVSLQIPALPNESESSNTKNANKGNKPNNAAAVAATKPSIFSIPNEAQSDIKKALEVNIFCLAQAFAYILIQCNVPEVLLIYLVD
jgi:hypothetical protein